MSVISFRSTIVHHLKYSRNKFVHKVLEFYHRTGNQKKNLNLTCLRTRAIPLTVTSDRGELWASSRSFHGSNSSWSDSASGTTKSISLFGDDCFVAFSLSLSSLRRSNSFFLSSFLLSISCLRFSLSCFRTLSSELRVDFFVSLLISGLNLFSMSITPLRFVGPMLLIFFSVTGTVETEKIRQNKDKIW